jgi:hypothetical protein
MNEADVILKFQIAEGRSPDALNAADALAAWVDVLRAAASVVEPGIAIRITLVGVEDGSQVFKLAIERAEQFLHDLTEGMKEFPLVSKAAMALGGLITGTAITVLVTNAMTPDVRIPDDQMKVFEEQRDLLKESVDLQRQQNRFYGILQEEPAYQSIEVLHPDMTVSYVIPRSEFGPRSGLWTDTVEENAPKAESRTATWDVTLIKPVLVPVPRRWRFAREGLEFSAEMADQNILQAIHDGTLPIQIAEGVTMKVEVTYREIYSGTSWMPVAGSHRIKRVLHPLPPLPLGTLFSPRTP